MREIRLTKCGTLNNTNTLQREQKGGAYDRER